MAKTKNSSNPQPATMEDLLASLAGKSLTTTRGQEIQGQVIAKTDKEVILDLGTKAEGVISKRDFATTFNEVKVGDTLDAFVQQTESESGQVILSLNRPSKVASTFGKGGRGIKWSKFETAKDRKTKLGGRVIEINKGGLIVEVDGVRGFLPSSLIGEVGEENLVGQELNVIVTEVDQGSNRLIFTQKGLVDAETLKKVIKIKINQKVKGVVVNILQFGALIKLDNHIIGIVFSQEASWDRQEDLSKIFKVGQEIEAIVISVDEDLGRLTLSTKQLQEDPFTKLTAGLKSDDVIKGVVQSVTAAGVIISLKNGLEGMMPANKIDPETNYQIGQEIQVLIDNVDKIRRRVNLAPFITSTAGLIYK